MGWGYRGTSPRTQALTSSARFSTRRRLFRIAVAAGLLFPAGAAAQEEGAALNVERLEPDQLAVRDSILQTLDPILAQKKQDGTAILLTWDDLYKPLNPQQQAFLDAFRKLKASALGATSHYFGELQAPPEISPVGSQTILKAGVPTPLDPQYLPTNVLQAYRRMMDAMKTDLNKQLLVESGYRSPAYQLYLFLFYMPKHGDSIKETNRFVALPGHSEHGYPPRQAIDFINEEGINGEDHPEQFEALPEYAWLQQRAAEFGFAISYPRDNALGTSFEPWHWHYSGE